VISGMFLHQFCQSGVNPVSDAVEKIMYPNPVKNDLFINVPYTKGEIISMTGSVVKVLDPMLNRADIRKLPKGIYLLKLEKTEKCIIRNLLR
jgi:hypothetical protein